jgi:hypothetical protein
VRISFLALRLHQDNVQRFLLLSVLLLIIGIPQKDLKTQEEAFCSLNDSQAFVMTHELSSNASDVVTIVYVCRCSSHGITSVQTNSIDCGIQGVMTEKICLHQIMDHQGPPHRHGNSPKHLVKAPNPRIQSHKPSSYPSAIAMHPKPMKTP